VEYLIIAVPDRDAVVGRAGSLEARGVVDVGILGAVVVVRGRATR
jgi:hypothetical protein